MLIVHPVDLDEVSPNAAYATHELRRRASRRLIGRLRPSTAPSVLMPAVLLAFGCFALLTLTGMGPRSWERRLCESGDLDIRACSAASPDVPLLRPEGDRTEAAR